jgi:NAD(P)-dependent dehydrogenase (short-subunit alcohol dehydrogenase family)
VQPAIVGIQTILLPQQTRDRRKSNVMTQHPKSDLSGVVFPTLAGRVAIITGAGQGIGRVFANAFTMAGAIVVIAERDHERGQAVATEVVAGGGKAQAIKTDVADPPSVEAMTKIVGDTYGRIDILINNAAIFSTLTMRPFEQIPPAEWDEVLRVNVTGAFLCSRAVVPAMRRAHWGRIINMASGAVSLGRPNYLHYITSKGALEAMSRSMARELGADGITVNAILPGATFTEIERKTVTPEQKQRIIEMQCVPRAEGPGDLVGTALFLASEASSFLTGQAIAVDGGATHR